MSNVNDSIAPCIRLIFYQLRAEYFELYFQNAGLLRVIDLNKILNLPYIGLKHRDNIVGAAHPTKP